MVVVKGPVLISLAQIFSILVGLSQKITHGFYLPGLFLCLLNAAQVMLAVTVQANFSGTLYRQPKLVWLKTVWVKFLFWGICIVSALLSELPLYSLGEAIAWFVFRSSLLPAASIFVGL